MLCQPVEATSCHQVVYTCSHLVFTYICILTGKTFRLLLFPPHPPISAIIYAWVSTSLSQGWCWDTGSCLGWGVGKGAKEERTGCKAAGGTPQSSSLPPRSPRRESSPAAKITHCEYPPGSKYNVRFKDKIRLCSPSYSQTWLSFSTPCWKYLSKSSVLTRQLRLNPRLFFSHYQKCSAHCPLANSTHYISISSG